MVSALLSLRLLGSSRPALYCLFSLLLTAFQFEEFFSYLRNYHFQRDSEHGKKQILQLVQSEGYRLPWKAHYSETCKRAMDMKSTLKWRRRVMRKDLKPTLELS